MRFSALAAGIVATVLWASPVLADTQITVPGGLTEAQIAQVRADAATAAAKTLSDEADNKPAAQKVNEWIQVGQGVGAGLAATANQLGLAVNTFANTPVGRLAVMVIIWKVMGHDILHAALALLWFFIMIPGWTWFYAKSWKDGVEITYEGGKRKTYKRFPSQFANESLTGYRILGIAPYVVITIVGLILLP